MSTNYYKQLGRNLYFPEFDSPSTNNGLAVDVDKDEYIGLLTTINYNNLRFQGKYSKRDKLIPTAPYETLFNDNRTKTSDEFNHIEAEYTYPFSETQKALFRGSIDYYKYSGSWPYTTSVQNENANGIWSTLSSRFNWAISSSNMLVAGLEFKKNLIARYKIWDNSTELFNKNILSSIWSFYIQDEIQIVNNLKLIGSIRYDDYSIYKGYFSPRGAIVYNIPMSTSFKFIYGSSLRIPNIYERYYEDAPTNFKPTPLLSPEKINTIEFIAEQRFFRDLYGFFSIYNYNVNDLIDQKFNSADSSLQYQNLNNVSATGFEVDLNYSTSSGMRAFLRYSYQYAKDVTLNSHLSNSPKHLLKAGLVYPFFNSFFCATELIYENGRLTVQGTKTEDLFLVNLTLTSNTLFNLVKTSLNIKNLFNTTYKYPGGFEHIQPSITQDGRTFFLQVQIDF